MTPREKLAFDAIVLAAERGEPCPSNADLCGVAGLQSVGLTSTIVSRLESQGYVAIQRGHRARVVTIVATGQRTAGTIATPHFTESLTPEGRAELAARKSRNAKSGFMNRGREGDHLPNTLLAARIARDQAQLRREREERHHWLDKEQRKYALPTRARPIEEMPI